MRVDVHKPFDDGVWSCAPEAGSELEEEMKVYLHALKQVTAVKGRPPYWRQVSDLFIEALLLPLSFLPGHRSQTIRVQFHRAWY